MVQNLVLSALIVFAWLGAVEAVGHTQHSTSLRESSDPVAQATTALARRASRVRSLAIAYAVVVESDANCEKYNAATYLVDFAASGDRFGHWRCLVADEDDPLLIDRPPYHIYDGVQYVRWWKESRVVEFTAASKTSHHGFGRVRTNHYLEVTGLWPYKSIKPPMDNFFLPDALLNGRCVANPGYEEIDGWRCVAFEGENNDRLWLAPAIGFALIKRRRTVAADGWRRNMVLEYRCSEFKEVEEDIWLPELIRITSYFRKKSDSRILLPLDRERIVVGHIAVNDERMGQFSPEYLPGTLVRDRRGNRRTIPGGTDLLDTLCLGTEEEKRRVVGETTRRSGRLDTVVWAAVMAMALVIIVMKFVGRRRSSFSRR